MSAQVRTDQPKTDDLEWGVSRSVWTAIAIAVFTVGALVLFYSAPHHGEFWWSDAPRHALNGVFLADMAKALPADPKSWAIEYYVRHPALTILFYPPLFYIISAPFFLLFGVSHATALSVVEIHYFALAIGLFFLTRRWTGSFVAIGVGLAAMAAPGVALWGRQVMLEVPSLALLTWAVVAFTNYLATKRRSLIYWSIGFALAAIYTKINAAFAIPVFVLALFVSRGKIALTDRHIWISALLFAVGLVPIAFLTLKFGSANVQSVMGIADSRVSRESIAGWLWYARQLPLLVGWPILALALLTPVIAMMRPSKFRLSSAEAALLGLWFIGGYVALSLIDLKEARHAVLIVPPILISAGLCLSTLWAETKVLQLVFMAAVLGTGAYTLDRAPVPSVAGYHQAAQWIAEHAPRNAIVLFSGKRDGSFVFNLRTFTSRNDISTIRVDKLLLTVSVRRTLGVSQKSISEAQISQMLDEDGVQYVVAQDDFWTDIPVMDRFQRVLRSSHFAKLTRIPVVANIPTEDKVVTIYKNLGRVNPHPKPLEMPLAIIGRSITGNVGK